MKKGFTLIELLAVIVILAIIALIATPLIMDVIEQSKKGAFKNAAYGIVEAGELGYAQDVLDGTVGEVTFIYTNGEEVSQPNGRSLDLKGTKPQNGKVKVDSNGEIALAIHDGTNCAQKGFNESEVTISNKIVNECVIPGFDIIIGNYNQTKGVNIPQLNSGMTSIIWNETTKEWDKTTEDDPDWYDYSNKKWANAQTEDGSMWVWIPRYAYQIASGYHTSTAGTINIKFLIGNTDTTSDETTIEENPSYNGDSQTNYVAHPAFTFGTEEVPGIWVAKFEPSVANQSDACYTDPGPTNCNKTTLIPKIIPNAYSWKNISIGNAFDVSMEMRNNTVYGWESDQVDTHLIKNSEWGAVTYLSKSVYGKETEIWTNPSYPEITGCAGINSEAYTVSYCPYEYDTSNGQKSSSTGNIYGIYDLSEGSYEYVSAYLDNGDTNLTTYGSSILSANDKYINIYSAGATDTESDNYEANSNVFGDAIYETSSDGTASIDSGWFGNSSIMFKTITPWIGRSGGYGPDAGPFSFVRNQGYAHPSISFRPAIIPG